MEWWQGFGGWLVTTVLAAVAAVGVLVELYQRWRATPAVHLIVHSIGTITLDDGEAGLYSLVNAGTARADAVAVIPRSGEQLFPDGDRYRIPSTLAPGSEHQFVVRSTDPERAHVMLTFVNASTRNAAVRWAPLGSDALLDEWLDQHDAWLRKTRWPWQDRDPVGPVGPSGQWQVVLPRRRPDAQRERMHVAFGEPL